MADEALFYENGKIKITKNVFYNGAGDNFIIANIKSMRDERKGRSIMPVLLAVICVAFALFTDFFAYSLYIWAGLAVVLLLGSCLQKELFVLFLTTPQGEKTAFKTKDSNTFQEVSLCLKKAIGLHQQGWN